MTEPTGLTDPPLAGDEAATLRGFLDYQRDVIRRKTEGLTQEQLNRTLPPSTMTLGGLLKHLAIVEHSWFSQVFLGLDLAEPWGSVDWDADADWEWHSAAGDTPAYLRGLYDATIAESDRILQAALAAGGLDLLSVREARAGGHYSVRWIVVHLIEEYARHAGHADLLREAIDGRTGD